MNITNLQKHYGKLTIDERFKLLNAAQSRGDDADRAALIQSAPRKVWSIPNTAGLSDAFDMASMFHVITMLGLEANYYFLLSIGDDTASEFESALKKRGDVSLMDCMYKIQHDILLTCEAWRVVCSEYGVDPVKILQGLPNAELIGLLETTVKVYFQDDPIELVGLDEAVNDIRNVIEYMRKRWE